MARGDTRELKKYRGRWIIRVMSKWIGFEDSFKDWELAKKLNDLLSKSIIIDAITNEFASCSAVRNDTVGKNLIARAYSSVGRAKAF